MVDFQTRLNACNRLSWMIADALSRVEEWSYEVKTGRAS